MISWLIDAALKRRLLTILLVVLVSAWGVVAYLNMPKDIYPDLNAPLVHIITENHGMPAEDVERLISFPLESLLNGAPHVTRVRSESGTGDSVVTVEFEWGTDIYLARQIVSSKLELITGRLPVGTTDPILGPVSSRMGEVFEFAVVGDGTDPMELRSLADWTIRYSLQGVNGVSFVINLGGFVKQFQVSLDPDMLRHYEISVSEVTEAIENSNRNFAGGVIARGPQETLIKGLGRIETIEHLKKTVVTSRNNVPVFVQDVADVSVGTMFRRGSASHNGDEAVYVTVEKQYGGDTLTTIENVKQALARIAPDLPAGVSIRPFYDQSKLILSSIDHVEMSILQGAILIVIVMMLFMWHLRSSLIAALTMPFSLLIAFVILDLFDVKLTVMSIGGLAIGLGKVANGSIIMVENVYRVLAEKRGTASTLELTAVAARDVGRLLFSANLIILLVFLPLLTMRGIEGAMFAPTAIAVAAALFGSLILNLTLKPVLASIFLTEKHVQNACPAMVTDRLRRWYEAVLRHALEHRKVVLVVCLIPVVIGALAYLGLGKEFVPELDEGQIMASTVMLPETSLAESNAMGSRIEEIFLAIPEVVSVSRTTGSAEGSEHVHPVNHSHYNVELLPREQRDRGYDEIVEGLRHSLDDIPGIAYIFEQPIGNKIAEMLTGAEGALSVKLFGPDLDVLNSQVNHIHDALAGIQGVADLQIEQTAGIPQLVIRLDRTRLARFGVPVGEVADLVETALNGITVTDVYESDRMTSVLVRLEEEARQNEDAIHRLLVDTPSGERIPLAQLASIERSEGPQTIFREDLMRRKIILCNVEGRDIGSFVEEAQKAIGEQVDLPPGYHVTFGGQYESQQRAMRHLTIVLAVVVLVIFVILLSTFGRALEPSVIMLAIPLTLVGGVIGLVLAGQTLNVSSTIGLIALFGIGIQNDVILIAKIRDLQSKGARLRDAVLNGSLTKFRAILMTNVVMIVGVLPLALTETTGAELHKPLAVVYIGGSLFAILLKMVAVPAMYETAARLREKWVSE